MTAPQPSSLYYWADATPDNGGYATVQPDGSIALNVDDDYYSGSIEPKRAVELASEVFTQYAGSHPFDEPPSETERQAFVDIIRTAPLDFPITTDTSRYTLDGDRNMEVCLGLRDIVVLTAVRLNFRRITAMPVLLELAAQATKTPVGTACMTRETFLENAGSWYDAVHLATPHAPALQKGGDA